MTRVHYKGSNTFCCSSENPCEEHLKKFPADPAQSAYCQCKEDWTDGTGWCQECKLQRFAQSALSAEQLANAEHDSVFPPWNEGDESPYAFIIRALAEHSDSHMTWVTHYEKNPEIQGKVSEGHSLEYQKRCIFRYNQIFRAFKELNDAAALRTAQLERQVKVCERAFQMQDAVDLGEPLGKMNCLQISRAMLKAETRAETAESALKTATNKIVELENKITGFYKFYRDQEGDY